MALKMSGYTGQSSLHDITGSCDLCGLEADSEVSEVVALDCSFQACPPEAAMYHQACLEKYLKSIRLERNRKIGFPCPRGCGKNTRYPEACRGKVLKSHPVMIRSEANKKRRQAELEHLQHVQARAAAEEGKGKKAAKKGEGEAPAPVAKGRKEDKGKKGAAIRALNVANTSLTSLAPPKSAAQVQKEQLAAAARSLKDQIAARAGGGAGGGAASTSSSRLASAAGSSGRLAPAGSGRLSAAGSREVKTLEEYLAERSGGGLERAASSAASSSGAGGGGGPAAAPAASAWGRSRASSQGSLGQDDGGTAVALASDDAFPPPPGAGGAPGRPPLPPRAGPAPVAAPSAPQGAWAARPAESSSSSASAGAGSLAPAAAGAGAAALLGGGGGHDAASIPGMEPPPGEAARLSKAQRKNLKRAERKAQAARHGGADDALSPRGTPPPLAAELPAPAAALAADASSAAGSEYSAVGSSTPAAELEGSPSSAAAVGAEGLLAQDRCMQLLVQHKLQTQVDQLQQLGFAPAACLAAVQAHGGSLEGAIAALLEAATGVRGADGGPGLGAALGLAPAPPEVDLTEELGRVHGLVARYGLPLGAVEALVVEYCGDLDSAERALGVQAAAAAGAAPHTAPAPLQGGSDSRFGDAGRGAPAAPSGLAAPLSLGGAEALSTPSAGSLFGPPPTAVPSASGWGDVGAPPPGGGGSLLPGGYSAFGFSGFTEAALQAVRGPPPPSAPHSSLFSSVDSAMGTPTVRDHGAAAPSTSGLWSDAPSPHAQASLLGGGGLGDAYAYASGSGLGPYGGSGAAPASALSPFDRPPAPALVPFPGATSSLGGSPYSQGLLGGAGGYDYGGLQAAAPPAPPQDAASLWSAVPGAGAGLGFGAGQPAAGGYGTQLEESELNQLMATLGCR
eukprot:scaffold2.g7317.t1